MPIRRGANLITRIYRGTVEVTRVFRGGTEIWRRNPVYTFYTPGTYTITAPAYAAFVDLGISGGGGGGATADNGFSTANGEGGNQSAWVVGSFAILPGQQITIVIGDGGTGASGGVKRSGTAGSQSTATGPGISLTAPGGTPGVGTTANRDRTGHGMAASSVSGVTLPNSADAASGTAGDPGGGGPGGPYPGWMGTPAAASNGGPGRGMLQFRSF